MLRKIKWKKYLFGALLGCATLSKAMVTEINQRKWYRIKPISKDNLCYDVKCGSEEDRTPIILWGECAGSKNQMFQFTKAPMNPGAYFIKPRHSITKCLDIEEGSQENRASCLMYHNIYFRGYGRHKNQEFYVSRVDSDKYRITPVHSQMPLGFDENNHVCQMSLDYSHDTIVQLVEVDDEELKSITRDIIDTAKWYVAPFHF